MHLHLITPFSMQTLEAEWIEVTTAVGNFVIQQGHAPMMLVPQENTKIIIGLANGTQKMIVITQQALVNIARTDITVLLHQEAT